jgi:hypothetical protein
MGVSTSSTTKWDGLHCLTPIKDQERTIRREGSCHLFTNLKLTTTLSSPRLTQIPLSGILVRASQPKVETSHLPRPNGSSSQQLSNSNSGWVQR